METKMFEIRDKGTFIPVLAIKLESNNREEHYLLRRAGFGDPMIQLVSFNREETHYDYNDWGDRTYSVAHKYISEKFDTLKIGEVIDVEYILGETNEKKESEQFE